jgi:hypothetical protein
MQIHIDFKLKNFCFRLSSCFRKVHFLLVFSDARRFCVFNIYEPCYEDFCLYAVMDMTSYLCRLSDVSLINDFSYVFRQTVYYMRHVVSVSVVQVIMMSLGL